MPQIRQYTSQESSQAGIGGRRATGADFYQAIGGEGADLKQAGRSLAGIGGILAKQEEDQEISELRRSIAETQTGLTEEWLNTQRTAQPGDLTIADKFSENVKTRFTKLGDGLKTRAAQNYLEQSTAQTYGHFRTNALQFQAVQAGKKAVLDQRATSDADANTIYADPSQYAPLLAKAEQAIDTGLGSLSNIQDGIVREELKAETRHKYASSAARSIAENRPMEFLRAVKPDAVTNHNGVPTGGTIAGSGFKSAVEWVLGIEGGYVAKDGKSGAPANFGINQRAHPNIDVSKLTRETAIPIYKDKYWGPSGADMLPPDAALVAFDAEVNHGPGTGKRITERAGGDPLKMIEIRRGMYERLAANDPEHAKNLAGWQNRMNKLEKQVLALKPTSIADELVKTGQAPKTNVPGFNDLPFDEKISVIRTAETRANQILSTGRAEMNRRLTDIEAEAQATGKVTNAPSKAELTQLYGPEEGARLHGEVQDTIQLGKDLKSVWGMSPADQNALLTSRTPVSGGGYAADLSRQNTLRTAIDTARKQRDADPAQYAYVAIPEVRSAMDALTQAKDPKAKEAAAMKYATATLAEQRRLGVLEPAILPKPMADSIVRSFYDQSQGGQNATLLVRDLQQTWGQNFQKIFNQVADKLPASALVIPGMDDAPATLLAEASKLKKDELWGGLPNGAKDSINEVITDVFTPFQQTLLSSPSGAKSYDVYRDQAATLAAMYVRGGESPSSAAKRAYKEILGKNYNFTGTYRVPVAVNVDTVQRGAQGFLTDAASLPLLVARSSTSGTTVESDRKAMASAISNNGHWVTSKGDSGLTLYYGDSAVLDVNGQPIFFTWAELEQKAKSKEPSGARFRFDIQTLR